MKFLLKTEAYQISSVGDEDKIGFQGWDFLPN